MPRRTMVVDAHHRVFVALAEGAHQVVGTFLHLGIGTLHGVEFDARAVASRLDRRHTAAAQTNTIVVATHNDHFIALLGCDFEGIATCAVAYTACEHDDLVVAIAFIVLLMFKREYATRDERLAKLIAEVARAVARLDENLSGCLIEPRAHIVEILPIAASL